MDQAWVNGLVGGLLIGTASALYMLFNGRIAGMTAIIANVMRMKGDAAGVLSLAFLVGAFGSALAWATFVAKPEIAITTNALALVASGAIVGLGVSFGNGCTSGHGISGMSRLSRRSIVATLTFMAATALSVFVLRHVFGVYL